MAPPKVVIAPESTERPILSSILLTRPSRDEDGDVLYASARWTT